MPPQKNSRYSYCLGIKRSGKLWLSSMTPFRYREYSDTRIHQTVENETLDQIAERYYGDDGWKWWWVIAQFQPNPIVDPTVAFDAGVTIYVPSMKIISQVIMNPSRRKEF